MKVRRLFFLQALTIAALAANLAACSDTTGNSPDTPKPSGETTPEKISISLMAGTWANPIPSPDSEGVKAINEKFQVDFKPQLMPWDVYSEKVNVQMASGDLPDIIATEFADSNFVRWVSQGAFLPLNEFVSQYDTMNKVEDFIWDALSVDGNIYGIPNYFATKGEKKPIIRQDWLDNLGLSMPTNYEELRQVALAFTENDPDQNGKKDTLGFGLARDNLNIWYDPAFSAYYKMDNWYHKNDEGQLIPGYISQANKEKTQHLATMYKDGSINKDWAITTYSDVFKAFAAGKVGIWWEQPGGESITMDVLLQNDPKAKVAPIPPFEAPDGTKGFVHGTGYYTAYMLNAKLKDNPEKVKRILEILEYFRQYVPVDQQNPSNEYFDWKSGHEGKGYTMENGIASSIARTFPPTRRQRRLSTQAGRRTSRR